MNNNILIIDNYDSFVNIICSYVEQLGATVDIVRNDKISEKSLNKIINNYKGIIISPGPGKPSEAGISKYVVNKCLEGKIPLLGVCLGHQAIVEELGGKIIQSNEIMHGKISKIYHNDEMFDGCKNPFIATRYHSLVAIKDNFPNSLSITAKSESNIIMGIKHKTLPIWGVQFHPESVLTESGYSIIANFLENAGIEKCKIKAKNLSPIIKH